MAAVDYFVIRLECSPTEEKSAAPTSAAVLLVPTSVSPDNIMASQYSEQAPSVIPADYRDTAVFFFRSSKNPVQSLVRISNKRRPSDDVAHRLLVFACACA